MLIGLLVDILLAFFIAFYAKEKGRSFIFWFVVSVVFDPIVGLMTLLLVSAVARLFRSSIMAHDQDGSVIDISVCTVSEHFGTVTPDKLYRQSIKAISTNG